MLLNLACCSLFIASVFPLSQINKIITYEELPMSSKGKHVVPRQNGGWAVKTAGKSRASKVYDKKIDAIKYARDVAKKEHGELYIHGLDGTIKERRSYGNDPFPPRDKK